MHHLGENLHFISDEIARWRRILEVPYQEYLLSRQELGVVPTTGGCEVRVGSVFSQPLRDTSAFALPPSSAAQ